VARDRQRSKQRRRRAASGGGDPVRDRAREIGLDDARLDESGLTDDTPAPDPLKNASAEVDQARAAEAGVERGPAGEVDLGGEEDVFEDETSAREPLPEEEDPFADEDDFERAPDEVQTPAGLRTSGRRRRLDGGDGDDGGGGGARTARGGGEPSGHRERGRLLTFLRACIDELKRVQWPDRKHVFQATAVVLGFVLVAGGWLGLMDAIWQPLINAIL
jgi:preprotein translocase SecE subunit